MDFKLTKEQEKIRDMAREFTKKELEPIAIENDEKGEFPEEAYRKLGEIGFVGLPYSKEYGGYGGDYLTYALAVEEVSKMHAAMGIAFSATTSLCAGAIYDNGSKEQKKKYLPDILSGKKVGAFAITEPNAGSDLNNITTTAVKKGDYYELNGLKRLITNGAIAETFVIFAQTDGRKGSNGISAFIVEKDFPGLSIGKVENKVGITAVPVAEIIFENCRVPAENLMGEEGNGMKIALKTLDGGRIGVAAQALGIAEGAFDIAKEYMKKRVQFGKPIYKHQYLGFKMAELATEIEKSRYLVYKAATDKDEGRPYTVSAAMAKLACSNTAMEVTVEAIQMLGGNGYMKEYHVERMMRDAKVTQIYEGTNEIQKMVISNGIFK